jgi:hypothetical protein
MSPSVATSRPHLDERVDSGVLLADSCLDAPETVI